MVVSTWYLLARGDRYSCLSLHRPQSPSLQSSAELCRFGQSLAPGARRTFQHHATRPWRRACVVAPGLWWLGAVDFVIYGGIDRAKGWALQRLNLQQNDAGWWRVFGADQFLHHLIHLGFILLIVAL